MPKSSMTKRRPRAETEQHLARRLRIGHDRVCGDPPAPALGRDYCALSASTPPARRSNSRAHGRRQRGALSCRYDRNTVPPSRAAPPPSGKAAHAQGAYPRRVAVAHPLGGAASVCAGIGPARRSPEERNPHRAAAPDRLQFDLAARHRLQGWRLEHPRQRSAGASLVIGRPAVARASACAAVSRPRQTSDPAVQSLRETVSLAGEQEPIK